MADSQFQLIAPYYDDLMLGVPYKYWVDYIEDIMNRLGFRPRTVLDVACGTGNVSEEMAKRGYEVVGADIAADMIDVARTKTGGVEYHVKDMAELDLGRRFDLAISLFDSLNYITDVSHLARAIARVGEHLRAGGLFIFDVNTIYALSHHFFDQANLVADHGPKYVWNSHYDASTRICRVDMTFEVVTPDGQTKQFKEVHLQRGHSLEELSQMLIESHFEVLEVFQAYKFRKPNRRSDRVFYVARRLPDV